jgi:cytochrome c oxidase subunit 2
MHFKKIPAALLLSSLVLSFSSCFPPSPPAKKVFRVELHARQSKWAACYTGDDSLFGKRNFKMYSAQNPTGKDTTDPAAADDFVVTEEFHVPLNHDIQFSFRSRDVIHSAYFPQLRAQMNVVPGMITTITLNADSLGFNGAGPPREFLLLCNKICGPAHYTMQMKMVVENESDFKRWWNEKKRART